MTAEDLVKKLEAQASANGWMARCPAHKDRKPSLSIAEGTNGTPLVHCHAGCPQTAVIKALRQRGFWPSPAVGHKGQTRSVVAIYPYTDERGDLLFQTVRYAPKDFRQRRPNGHGGWEWDLDGVRRVLYRLPEVLAAERVFIVEGEKDVETLRSWELAATCNPMGAGKWREEYSRFLTGKHVIIIPDGDEPGRRHAQEVAASLNGVAQSVRVVALPEGKDVTDWQEKGGTKKRLLELVGATAKLPKGSPTSKSAPLPDVRVSDRELRDVTGDCITALRTANDPPKLFVRAGLLAHVVRDESGRPSIRTVSEAFLRGCLSRVANFQRATKNNIKAVSPPLDAVRDILSRPPVELGLPPLVGVVEGPILRADGSLLIREGYDATLHVVYAPTPRLVISPIPDHPARKDVRRAVTVIDDVIGEFPWADDASRANAFAMLLTPVIRRAVHGSVPLALIDAPQAGSGKTLLAEVVAMIHSGAGAVLRPAPGGRDDEEWRKSIAALLLAGHPLTILDNVERTLDSPSLALAVTASTFATRILGRTEDLVLSQQTVFIVTGNNIALGGDLPRRCFWIRLDAQSSRPWQHRHFLHPHLRRYVAKRRGELLSALLTMTRGWYVAAKPPAKVVVLGSFEDWCRTVGGILAFAGVEGFLGNLEALYEQADPGEGQWEAFLGYLHKNLPRFAINDLIQTCADDEGLRAILPDDLAEPDAKRGLNAKRIAWAFRKRIERRYGRAGWHLVKRRRRTDGSGVVEWEVRSAKEGK